MIFLQNSHISLKILGSLRRRDAIRKLHRLGSAQRGGQIPGCSQQKYRRRFSAGLASAHNLHSK